MYLNNLGWSEDILGIDCFCDVELDEYGCYCYYDVPVYTPFNVFQEGDTIDLVRINHQSGHAVIYDALLFEPLEFKITNGAMYV